MLLKDFRVAGVSRKSQVFGECCWLILGLLVQVANRIPRWDATEDILWECLTVCPAIKVGLSACHASPWPSRWFHDGMRISACTNNHHTTFLVIPRKSKLVPCRTDYFGFLTTRPSVRQKSSLTVSVLLNNLRVG